MLKKLADQVDATDRHYSGGEIVKPASGEYLDNFDPSRDRFFARSRLDDRDVHLAVEAAKFAFPRVTHAAG